MSVLFRFVPALIIFSIFGTGVLAQESYSIRVSATVVNPDIVKASATLDELGLAAGPYSKIIIFKSGGGNLQMNISSPEGVKVTKNLGSDDGEIFHEELLTSGKKKREESSIDPNPDSLTVITLIYTDI